MPYFPPQQTAIQLLNKIKTVDGSGSGLDADTIDGLHANELSTVANLNDLTDVTISTPSTNQVLLFNGSVWVNGTITSGVTDHGDLTGLGDNDHPQYYLASNVSAYGASLVAAVNAATARTLLELGSMAVATEANYLLVDGTRASTGRQVFSAGITTGIVRVPSNSTTAGQWQDASGTAVVTVDTMNRGVIISNWLRNATGSISQYSAPSTVNQFLFSSNGFFDANAAVWYALDATLPGWRCDMASHTSSNSDIFTVFHRNAGAAANSWAQYLAVFGSGNMALGAHVATALLDLAASNTTRSSLRLRSGVAPTSPNNGDIWFDGTNLKIQIAGVTKTFTVT